MKEEHAQSPRWLFVSRVFLLSILVVSLVSSCIFYPSPSSEPSPEPTWLTVTPTPSVTPFQTNTPEQVTFYIATFGSNSNPGTLELPWQTIQYAVDHARPGDTLVIRGGTYTEHVIIGQSGEISNPITLTAFSGEQVTIVGQEKPALSTLLDVQYWVIKGLDLESAGERTVELFTKSCLFQSNKVSGSVYLLGSDNVIDQNEIDGSHHDGNGNGIMDDSIDSHHNVFTGNHVHHFSQRGIWTQWLTHDNIIDGNLVEAITSERGICIDADGATNVEYGHTIRNNIVRDCGQTGIELENAYESIVENNVIYNTGLEGVQVINYEGCEVGGENGQYGEEDGDCRGDLTGNIVRQNLIYSAGRVGGIVSYQAGGVRVENNTVYGCDGAGLFLKNGPDLSPGWVVVGNIFAGNGQGEISLVDGFTLARDDYNLLYPAAGRTSYLLQNNSSPYSIDLAHYQANFDWAMNSIEGDPLFVSLTAYDFHLRSGSPAIDAGIDVGIQADLDGVERPQGKGVDMGVYEFSVQP